jgi:hypothetical protein
MKHFVDPKTEQIHAYEDDGSQDFLIDPTFVPIEGDALDELRAKQQAAFAAAHPIPTSEQKLAEFLASNPDVMSMLMARK